MNIELTFAETRVIGCLVEKEISTPDQYPLSLNALVNACNQKSNRDPVLNLGEAEVQDILDGLVKKHLVVEKSGFGSRVAKYQHHFCNTEFGHLRFDEQELGIVCELFLRGPQTPGELRTHTQRLCRFADVHETEAVLQRLSEREDGPFVVRLPREPGKRESRYAHLFSGKVEVGIDTDSVPAMQGASGNERIDRLEQEVAQLRAEVAELRQLIDELTS